MHIYLIGIMDFGGESDEKTPLHKLNSHIICSLGKAWSAAVIGWRWKTSEDENGKIANIPCTRTISKVSFNRPSPSRRKVWRKRTSATYKKNTKAGLIRTIVANAGLWVRLRSLDTSTATSHWSARGRSFHENLSLSYNTSYRCLTVNFGTLSLSYSDRRSQTQGLLNSILDELAWYRDLHPDRAFSQECLVPHLASTSRIWSALRNKRKLCFKPRFEVPSSGRSTGTKAGKVW